jgi:hypothetical protein
MGTLSSTEGPCTQKDLEAMTSGEWPFGVDEPAECVEHLTPRYETGAVAPAVPAC